MADDIRLKRPARRQADPSKKEQTQTVSEGTYNIWYNKWTGQKNHGRFERGERAPTRCCPDKDVGYTMADKRAKSNPNGKTYFCLQFARGSCYLGHKCEFYHRIPRLDDGEETIKDCFGRERHRDEREDMGGVGSFNRQGRTVYIGNLHPYGNNAEQVVAKHFSPFGEVEKLRVIHPKSIAFVQYKKRANAEFAREAMEHQTLDAGEVLNVRWANDDPNPRVKVEIKRKQEEDFVESWVTKKARGGELQYMDEETKKLLAAHPVYQQQYQYYQEQTTPTVDQQEGEQQVSDGLTTQSDSTEPMDAEATAAAYNAYYQYYYYQQLQQQQQQEGQEGDMSKIQYSENYPSEESPSTLPEQDTQKVSGAAAQLGLAAYGSSDEEDENDV